MLNGVRKSGYAAWAVLAGLIASSICAIFWIRPAFLFPEPSDRAESALSELARATAGARLTTARLNGPFSWAAPSPDRERSGRTLPLPALEAAAAIDTVAASEPTSGSLNALGVSRLVAGKVDESVEVLEDAVALAPDSAGARSDLAAAYFERWQRDRIAIDAVRALSEAELAVQKSRVAAPASFNAALSTQALGSPRAATRAWQRYLKVDPDSDWAKEARGYLAEIDKQVSAGPLSREDPKSDAEFAKRDHYQRDLAKAIAASAGWAPARRECLVSAIALLTESSRLFDSSEYARAADAAEKASTRFRCAGFTAVESEIQRAWAIFFDGRRQDALTLAAPVAAAASARGYNRPAGRYHYMNGLWLLGIGKMTDAVTAYGQATEALTRAGDTELVVAAEALLGEAYKEQGDHDLAWGHLQTALSQSDILSPRRRYLVLSQALLAATQGGLDGAALAFLDELSAVTREWNQPVADLDVSLRRARLLSKIGRADEAKNAISRARETLRGLPAGSARDQYAADLAWTEGLALQQIEPASAVVALTAAHEAFARLSLPFRLAEVLLARGRAFRAQGRLKEAEQDWERGLEILEDQRPGIREQQLRISRASELWDLYAELIDIRVGDPAAALETAERSRARALLDWRARAPVTSAENTAAVHDRVPAGTTALVYAVLPERLLVWRLHRGGIQLHVQSIPAARLESLAERYVAHLRSAKASPELDELSRLLLPVDLPRDAEATLAFLPDGPLHRIPFGSLKNPATGRAIAADFIPVVAPSLTLMKTAAPAPVRAVEALLIGVATARAEPRLAFLPEVAGEIDDLVRLYPRHTVLDDRSATAARILDGLSRSGVVHFAGHAIADQRYPARSRLMIARGSSGDTLTAEDLAAVRLTPGAVVVLGACQTAGGRVFRGEGVMSLARPFLVGGASAVVASLWPVDDRTSRRLLYDFHTRLRAGDSPARALAMSQRMMSGDTPVVHWSAFQVLVAQ